MTSQGPTPPGEPPLPWESITDARPAGPPPPAQPTVTAAPVAAPAAPADPEGPPLGMPPAPPLPPPPTPGLGLPPPGVPPPPGGPAWPPPLGGPAPTPLPGGPLPGTGASPWSAPAGSPPITPPSRSHLLLLLGLGGLAAVVLAVLIVVAVGSGGGSGEEGFALPDRLDRLALQEDADLAAQREEILTDVPAGQRDNVLVGRYGAGSRNLFAILYEGTAGERESFLSGFNDRLESTAGGALEAGDAAVETFDIDGRDVYCLEGAELVWCRADRGDVVGLLASTTLDMDEVAEAAAEAVG